MSGVLLELFGLAATDRVDWNQIVRSQSCPLLGGDCLKIRKSRPDIAIGTCAVAYGVTNTPVIICPYRLLERRQLFTDCLHLLSRHQPGNELHVVREMKLPGGNVDFFVVSARDRRPVDFVGLELQTLDTTGTVWPTRQRFLKSQGVRVNNADVASRKSFGINWKMTAKTVLVQLHHKVTTFEGLGKHLVVAMQDCLFDYINREFELQHLNQPSHGDALHLHVYNLGNDTSNLRLQLADRRSTDSTGVAKALGLKTEAKVELDQLLSRIEAKLSDSTLWKIA